MDQTRISRDEEIPRYTPSTPNRIGKERAEQSKPSSMNMNKLIEQHQSSNQHRWMHSRRKRIGQNRIGSDKYRHLQDVCCLILICSDHNRIALIEQNHEQKGLFLPNFRFKQTNHSIKQIVRNFLQKIFIYDDRGWVIWRIFFFFLISNFFFFPLSKSNIDCFNFRFSFRSSTIR